jgi:hypothetical protein
MFRRQYISLFWASTDNPSIRRTVITSVEEHIEIMISLNVHPMKHFLFLAKVKNSVTTDAYVPLTLLLLFLGLVLNYYP